MAQKNIHDSSDQEIKTNDDLLMFNVQTVKPVSLVDDLISNMLQEPTITQEDQKCNEDYISKKDTLKEKLTLSNGETGDQNNICCEKSDVEGNEKKVLGVVDDYQGTSEETDEDSTPRIEDGTKLQYENPSQESSEESLRRQKRQKKRNSRRKTNDGVSSSRAKPSTPTDTSLRDVQNDQAKEAEIKTTENTDDNEKSRHRRKKKRKTNEECTKIENDKNIDQTKLTPKSNQMGVTPESIKKDVLQNTDSLKSVGEKPKVVVPTPRGIPRPRRKNKDGKLEPEAPGDSPVGCAREKKH